MAWAWLARPKANVVKPKNQPLPKHLRKITSKSAKHACHYATKKDPLNNNVFGFGHHNEVKVYNIFERCAILNVLNYLTKNFES